MQLDGTIKQIGQDQTIGDKGFKKRELVLETSGEYPQKVLIEFVQDKTELLNKFKVNESVTIAINIKGREWKDPNGETKYFNTIQGWKIDTNQED